MQTHDTLIQSEYIDGYEIKFVLKPNKKDIAHLVVLFNGYRHGGFDFGNAINFIKCNVLMIVDVFQGKQSCYLGENGNFDFSEIIPKLIDKVLNNLNLNRQDCTLLGASKGGFASLYIGIKYNFSNIISSAPSVSIGSWMKNYDMEIANNVMGEHFSENSVIQYDNLIFEAIKNDVNKDKKIYFFFSEKDNFYLDYGQKKLLDVLSQEYRNLSRFITSSPLVFQHDQVTAYFVQDILSLTYLLSQGIIFNEKKTHLPAKMVEDRKEVKLQNNEEAINNIHLLNVANGKLFIEGLGYIKNYHSPTVKDIHKYLLLENVLNNIEYEYLIGSTNKHEKTRELYENTYINYTSSGVATMQFKGVNLNNVEDGTYIIKISISKKSDEREYKSLSTEKLLEGKYIHNGKEYYIFKIKNDYFITKRDILGKLKSDLFSITKKWCKDSVFHLEGKYAILGMCMPEFYIGNYYLVAKNQDSNIIYSNNLGNVRDKNISNEVGDLFGNYTACYFATMHFKGVDITSWKDGVYNLYISMSVKNELFSQDCGVSLLVKNGKCEFI